MEAFIIYIAKSGICTGIFLVIYALFLRKTTFFRFNRFFLVAGFIVSLVLPAIKYTYDVIISIPVIPVEESIPAVSSPVVSGSAMDIWSLLFVLYIAGVIIFSIRNAFSYRKLKKYIRTGQRLDTKDYKLVESNIVKLPFTVLNFILINTARLSSAEKDLILKHEITHIRQKHWIDLIVGECMLLLQWFNPLIWMYVYLLKENHEFLADRAVIDSGVSPALYQAVLINQEFQGPVFSFSNSFSYSKPLNRLSMMKKTKSASWKRLTALMIIPVSGLFLWASAEPRYILESTNIEDLIAGDISKDTIKMQFDADKQGDTKKVSTYYFTIGDTIDGSNKKKVETKVFMINEKEPPLVLVDDVEISDIKSVNPDDIADIHVIKDMSIVDPVYAKRGKNGIVLVTTKKAWSSKNKIAADSISSDIRVLDYRVTKGLIGEVVGADFSNKITTSGDTVKLRIRKVSKADGDKPLIILDGEKIPYEKMKEISPNTIDNISVLKDKSAIGVYGEDGKGGVIIIQTKEYAKDNPSDKKINDITVIGYGTKKKINHTQLDDALLVINGKEEPDMKVGSLDPDKIESVSILKGEEAIKKYGDKGKNGVIEIKTK